MRIERFQIENFRNLRLAECTQVPDFIVICGGNGCGKSALLEALMTAKEHAGAYGYFSFDPRVVSSRASTATITMELSLSDTDRAFVKDKFRVDCPEREEIVVEINKGGGARTVKRSNAVHNLLSFYGSVLGSPGFFDYFTANRQIEKLQLQTWDASFLSDDLAKQTLARPNQKFQHTKRYLAGLKMHDLQELQSSLRVGSPNTVDSLSEIRDFFDRFFAPMQFKDVYLDKSPFEFVVSTPLGDIDVDDLSSGEKEILNVFVRFHQLKHRGAVILFDEADAHLHPDLERRYLDVLKTLGQNNQLILTTHSPEMMIAAGSESLHTILKSPPSNGGNQFIRVTQSSQLHDVLSDMMGSRGIVSFNQRIIFIEGEDASADRFFYESLYPPSKYNISFVPAGNSSTIRKTAERVNELLTISVGFQQYFSIIDGDMNRLEIDPTAGKRIFRLPVYHVENFLIDEKLILKTTKQLLGNKCPYTAKDDIENDLKRLSLSDAHLKPYAKAVLDAKAAKSAKEAYDAVFSAKSINGIRPIKLDFASIESEARAIIQRAIDDGSWRSRCKGRDLLKAYCGLHSFNYDQFRNLLISNLSEPPEALTEIISQILGA